MRVRWEEGQSRYRKGKSAEQILSILVAGGNKYGCAASSSGSQTRVIRCSQFGREEDLRRRDTFEGSVVSGG